MSTYPVFFQIYIFTTVSLTDLANSATFDDILIVNSRDLGVFAYANTPPVNVYTTTPGHPYTSHSTTIRYTKVAKVPHP